MAPAARFDLVERRRVCSEDPLSPKAALTPNPVLNRLNKMLVELKSARERHAWA
jgi:hypothetical protein